MALRGTKKPKVAVVETSDQRGMGYLIGKFKEWQQIKAYSELTIYGQEKALEQFAKWCAERGITRPCEVVRPVLERYQRHLFHYRKTDGYPLAFHSIHHLLVPIRSFFRWLTKNNFLLSNPAADVDLPKRGKHLPRVTLTGEEAEKIMNQVNITNPMGIRDRAILETFYSTGVRRKELLRIKCQDLDMKHGILLIRDGKGNKDRIIPVGERAIAWINKYLKDIRPHLVVEPDNGTLFITREGFPFSGVRLGCMVRDYVRAAGVGKDGSCHMFRHTMATLMLENGAGLRFIQRMLGHAQLSTTEIYTQVSTRKLKEIFMATHPGARLQRNSEIAKLAVDDGVLSDDDDEAWGDGDSGHLVKPL
ncbi:MAG: site-specific tyrosine recombinase XerC [Candidatus Riflebacteria bacterium]|nr:site-specific tyrosine recombinase XerC [Candidatus Riflebacteria bacterium]